MSTDSPLFHHILITKIFQVGGEEEFDCLLSGASLVPQFAQCYSSEVFAALKPRHSRVHFCCYRLM